MAAQVVYYHLRSPGLAAALPIQSFPPFHCYVTLALDCFLRNRIAAAQPRD